VHLCWFLTYHFWCSRLNLASHPPSLNTHTTLAEVRALGFEGSTYPDTTQLKFVMLDEFFPMHSTHRNSFCRLVCVCTALLE